jgi:hypothetical protein
MKKLKLTKMLKIEGGLTNRQCMLAGAGLVIATSCGLWGAVISIGVGSADCW